MKENSTRPAAEETTTSKERRVFFVINAKAGKCDAEASHPYPPTDVVVLGVRSRFNEAISR